MQSHRYFIFDCEDRIVGNPKGYPTHRGAMTQAHTRKLQNLIWDRFYARPDKSQVKVWEIHCLPVVQVQEVR